MVEKVLFCFAVLFFTKQPTPQCLVLVAMPGMLGFNLQFNFVALFCFLYLSRSTMERGSIYYTLVFIVSFLPKTYASHRIFSCGESVSNLKTCLQAVYLIGSLTRKTEKK